jgi:hypothetical protein
MAYIDCTLSDLAEKYGITNHIKQLFNHTTPVEPSSWLLNLLQIAQELPIRAQKQNQS